MGLLDSPRQHIERFIVDNELPVGVDGTIQFAQGLTPERIKPLVGLLFGRQFRSADEAVLHLLREAGVQRNMIDLVRDTIHDGRVNFTAGVRLFVRGRINLFTLRRDIDTTIERIRLFVIRTVVLPEAECPSLEDAVRFALRLVAEELECDPEWDVLLEPARQKQMESLSVEWLAERRAAAAS